MSRLWYSVVEKSPEQYEISVWNFDIEVSRLHTVFRTRFQASEICTELNAAYAAGSIEEFYRGNEMGYDKGYADGFQAGYDNAAHY